MKIEICGYQVDIKVKKQSSARANAYDAGCLLNQICIWANESADLDDMRGCHATAKASRADARKLFRQLAERGVYD